MSDWIISVGTGSSQKPLIESAKRSGYKILGIDKNPNNEIIDYQIQESTYDHEKVIEHLSSIPFIEKIIGVIARVSGPALYTAAKIGKHLNLPSASLQIAKMSVSKSYLREVAERKGVQTISGRSLNKLPKWIEGSDFVLKPDQPVIGKKNVYRVKNKEDFVSAYNAASNESLNNVVECQNFEEGVDIGLITASSDGKILWHFAYEEINSEENGNFKGVGVKGPAESIDDKICNKILESAQVIIDSSNSSGFIFFSFRVSKKNGAKLYEVNPGLCGDNIADKLFKKIWPESNFFDMDVLLATKSPIVFPDNNLAINSIVYQNEH